MADTSASGVAPAAPAGTPAPTTQAAPEDLVDLELEPGKSIKVPRSKLDPHLAKHRSETDRLRSEYDRNHKAFTEKQTKLEAVLKAAKDNPDDALKALGLDPDAYAEAKLAARVRAAQREAEEAADPAKKTAREQDEELKTLREKAKKADELEANQKRDAMLGKVKGFVGAVVAKLPEEMRDFATADVVSIVRRALAEGKDIKIEEAASAAQKLIIERLVRVRKHLPAEGAPVPGAPPKHPAAAPRKGAPKPAAGADLPTAGDLLMDLQWGRK